MYLRTITFDVKSDFLMWYFVIFLEIQTQRQIWSVHENGWGSLGGQLMLGHNLYSPAEGAMHINTFNF